MPATIEDIPHLLSITRDCAAKMISEGIYQWNETYPNKEAFEKDVLQQQLYVLSIEEEMIGCVVLSSEKDTEYEEVKWLTEDKKALYIHRLAVHPLHQKHGYARKLMDFAEDLAITKGAVSVRLDTFSRNKRNQKFYKARGYHQLSSIFFPKQSPYPFYCFEKILVDTEKKVF